MAELDIRPSSTIVICGKRNEGKSVLAKWLLYNLVRQEKVDIVYLFSPTEHLSHSFDCVPKQFVIPTFDIPFMDKVIASQSKEIQKTKLGKDDPSIKQILFVFDDMLGSVTQGSREQLLLNRLFATSRHIKIGVMVLSQTTKGLFSPALRQNTDYLFFRKSTTTSCLRFSKACTGPVLTAPLSIFTIRSTASSMFGFLAYDNLTRDDRKFFLITAERPDFNITYCAEKNSKTRAKKSD